MTETSREYKLWLEYADEDLKAAEELIKVQLYNSACFHAHQAAEKSLKAFLVKNKVNPPRIHKLVGLIRLCKDIDEKFEQVRKKALRLDVYYIPTRYPNAPVGSLPDGLPNKKDADDALEIAKTIREFIEK
ncbi:MAG: HEPN domain-containing protein [Thermoanaerobacteraceae bacterium]|nr:HEPN domain-containing protein [Thermoanaerobacteraceae bacterium]